MCIQGLGERRGRGCGRFTAVACHWLLVPVTTRSSTDTSMGSGRQQLGPAVPRAPVFAPRRSPSPWWGSRSVGGVALGGFDGAVEVVAGFGGGAGGGGEAAGQGEG